MDYKQEEYTNESYSSTEIKKTDKEIEKERKKKEKERKFIEKKELQAKSTVNLTKKEKKTKKHEFVVEDEYIEITPLGQKKILQNLDLPALKNYNPPAVESAWYEWWQHEGFHLPEMGPDGNCKSEGSFVIPVPPPNITGILHIGHALTVAIQDSLVRWQRMKNKTVLFLPGFDHAGLSTQSVVEKRLWVQEKKTRHDFSREEFVDIVVKWKESYSAKIKSQLMRLGGSYDWSREAYTIDDNMSKAVIEHFVRLHEDGVIYRANKIVNWCTFLNTTLSNLEVDQIELSGRTLLKVPGYDKPVEFGVLVYFAYEIYESNERIIVATTRLETMLGDTAIAVHPDDHRYKHLHGKMAKHPFVDRLLPIITDSISIDMTFGTGAVKITPAHDINDYEIGKRHNLLFINILNPDGTMNENAGDWKGLKRFDVRVLIAEELKKRGLFVDIKDNPMIIPICSKSKDIIEPLIKPQWWVNQKAMSIDALNAVKNGEIKIAPKTSERDFYRWMENIQDWCISRQLWWGHRIPAYFVKIEGEVQDYAENKWWVSGQSKEIAQEKAKKLFPGKSFILEQDEDVLDTWFSSCLWPFSTLGWPKETDDFKKFYPMSLLETGWDILFFWVARMIMVGIKLTGQVPFREVFCHSLVRDSQGRKMSKSLGNIVDPIDVIEGISLEDMNKKISDSNLDIKEQEIAKKNQKKNFPNGIPQCGTDALRFALCAYTTGGHDINLDILRVEGYRKFCNKIYNATKYALLKLGTNFIPNPKDYKSGNESLVERWILHKYTKAVQELNTALEEKNFYNATNVIYNFWLYEFCDIYIENSKVIIDKGTFQEKKSAQDTLYTCLDGALRMTHPFMPFITEELWQRLPRRPGDTTISIVKSRFPVYNSEFNDEYAHTSYNLVFSLIQTGRSLMAEYNIRTNAQLYFQVNDSLVNILESQINIILSLIKGCKSINILRNDVSQPEGCIIATVHVDCNVLLLVKGQVDFDIEIEKAKKKIEKNKCLIFEIEKQINKEDYNTKVPETVKLENMNKYNVFMSEIASLEKVISDFQRFKI
ncbi:unnamed protein product [Pneumocystis jirovecii]|uniref:Valine--tRNA ligase, mitochondrial n=2 Tax=Pneumocystis jirovecii TaxID=42068 RepID=L0PDB3_PNEJI|nr:valine-tRNA ligase [Pneumocystis jirovecii RU7]KTW26892.1 valine-tRNA ligase [Pneumocystis jirovecii RU7]CCJ30343.1 unnamed protein product [Pneumocystis jirovecii]